MDSQYNLEEKAIYTIRFLSAEAIQKANSGHPGLPMGTAALGYTLWARHLRFNPHNPSWVNRDRFILSGGHGSMLLYSLLHLTGFDLSMDEIENFRQWSSRTPGHPEYGLTPGVEATTGPLGQGFATGVGMAIAQAHLAATFHRPQYPIFDYFIYGIVADGDLMEGVASLVIPFGVFNCQLHETNLSFDARCSLPESAAPASVQALFLLALLSSGTLTLGMRFPALRASLRFANHDVFAV